MSNGGFTVVYPRGRNIKDAGKPVLLTLEMLESHYGKSVNDAANAVGISVTTFKKRCRMFGITSWPNTRVRTNHEDDQSAGSAQALAPAAGYAQALAPATDFAQVMASAADFAQVWAPAAAPAPRKRRWIATSDDEEDGESSALSFQGRPKCSRKDPLAVPVPAIIYTPVNAQATVLQVVPMLPASQAPQALYQPQTPQFLIDADLLADLPPRLGSPQPRDDSPAEGLSPPSAYQASPVEGLLPPSTRQDSPTEGLSLQPALTQEGSPTGGLPLFSTLSGSQEQSRSGWYDQMPPTPAYFKENDENLSCVDHLQGAPTLDPLAIHTVCSDDSMSTFHECGI